ncbi:protein of unknown function [Taphrina deformans PYCC 5710]|uniref:GH16 domain-containing protein n=1 Tax=Taphrina deformans (strain PYCC 5710 / ATCC 11124 / CBS 356.35 / IMI 108563 / JCM 9778 / NBRC 8474) TaxID=1097556 RepID=R4XE19_TAPDE|nr:protein of unknown function [Taphrina deformans PYCC 5710]|eukprot:CCG84106.1 protein of unknown function [Taphrina deformans PYCC 5710]
MDMSAFGITEDTTIQQTFSDNRTRRQSVRNPFLKTTREKEKPVLRHRPKENWGQVADKYWLAVPPTKREKWSSRIVWMGMGVGGLLVILFAVLGYLDAATPATCKLFDDDFRYGTLDTNLWRYEISTGGGNAGSFEWTTDSTDNAFVKDGKLHIRPTLVETYPEGTTFNLTADGTCTDPYFWCSMTQNSTAGTTINPIKSAKLSTKISMQYGEAQIKVKFPKGDWIWSQIQLNPDDDFYGAYPANGQIVLAQTRGNSYQYSQGGNDNLDSFLAYGPDGFVGLGQTLGANKKLKFTDFSDGFHVIGIVWTPTHIRTWVDDPVNTMLLAQWNKFGGFWKKGGWQKEIFAGVFDPWSVAYPSLAAPFDRHFHLTLQLGVGGMNGIFDDDQPWQLSEGRDTAMTEFRAANTTWYKEWPTGDDRDLIVDSITMRQQCVVKPTTYKDTGDKWTGIVY